MSEETLRRIWENNAKPLLVASGQSVLSTPVYDGIFLWPVLKSALIMTLLNQYQTAPLGHPLTKSPRFLDKVKSKIETKILRTSRPTASKQAEFTFKMDGPDVLCLGNIGPTLKRAGGLYNPHFDPLRFELANCGMSSFALYYDTDLEGLAFEQNSASIKSYTDMAINHASLKAQAMEDLWDIFETALQSANIRELNLNLSPEFFVHRVAVILECRKFFRTLFTAYPEIRTLLMTNYYNPVGWGALYAAHDHDIRRIDIQHGAQGRFHHAYSGFELSQVASRPDGFLCWDKRSAENLDEQLGVGHTRIIGLSSVRSVSGSVKTARRLHGSKRICIFLQYTESRSWLQALRAELPNDVHIGVRRHPGALKKGFIFDLPEGCESCDETDMARLLLNLDLAVTGYSTSALEAEEFGVPVIAYSVLAPAFLDAGRTVTPITHSSPEPEILAAQILTELEKNSRNIPKLPEVPNLQPIAKWVLTGR